MTWHQKTVVAILLLVARIISDNSAVSDEIKTLAIHISVWTPKGGTQ